MMDNAPEHAIPLLGHYDGDENLDCLVEDRDIVLKPTMSESRFYLLVLLGIGAGIPLYLALGGTFHGRPRPLFPQHLYQATTFDAKMGMVGIALIVGLIFLRYYWKLIHRRPSLTITKDAIIAKQGNKITQTIPFDVVSAEVVSVNVGGRSYHRAIVHNPPREPLLLFTIQNRPQAELIINKIKSQIMK